MAGDRNLCSSVSLDLQEFFLEPSISFFVRESVLIASTNSFTCLGKFRASSGQVGKEWRSFLLAK